MEPIDYGLTIAAIQCQFALHSLTWDSPRVQAWVERVRSRTGKRIKKLAELPDLDMLSLARQLSQLPIPAQPAVALSIVGEDRGAIGQHSLCSYAVSANANHTRIELDLFGVDALTAQSWLQDALSLLDDQLSITPPSNAKD